MKAVFLTKDDSKSFGHLAASFYIPTINAQTGQAAVQLNDDPQRLDASLALLHAFQHVRQPDAEPPALRVPDGEKGVWFEVEDAPFSMLNEHWTARRRILPPALAEDVKGVNDLLARAKGYTPEELTKAKAKQAKDATPADVKK